jgi:hypothetical protein
VQSFGHQIKNNMENQSKSGVDFWIKMFTPRTDKWKRDTLKRLRADKQVFGTLQETQDKIQALKSLLNQ